MKINAFYTSLFIALLSRMFLTDCTLPIVLISTNLHIALFNSTYRYLIIENFSHSWMNLQYINRDKSKCSDLLIDCSVYPDMADFSIEDRFLCLYMHWRVSIKIYFQDCPTDNCHYIRYLFCCTRWWLRVYNSTCMRCSGVPLISNIRQHCWHPLPM